MDSICAEAERLLALPPSTYCQGFFVLCSVGILTIQATPKDIRNAFMKYGARSDDTGKEKEKSATQDGLSALLISLTRYGQVPHHWFLHFYVLSVLWSVFWAWQYVQKGSILGFIVTRQAQAVEPSMSLEQVYIAWLLMALQGLRRLYESIFVMRQSSSSMWFAHWVFGVSYYTATNVAVWVEGSGTILDSWESQRSILSLSPRSMLGVGLYLAAYWNQHQCHSHLASLKKYTLPNQGLFRYIVCPHYTCECIIYISIAIVAAPPGSFVNKTVLCGMFLAAVNLGATAHGTRQWYVDKFGSDAVAKKWTMLPPIF